jgi:hypothetical protein
MKKKCRQKPPSRCKERVGESDLDLYGGKREIDMHNGEECGIKAEQ